MQQYADDNASLLLGQPTRPHGNGIDIGLLVLPSCSMAARYCSVQQLSPINADKSEVILLGIANQHMVSGNNLFRRLQTIQNAAARLLTGTWRRDHISPVLSRLHWLSMKQRVVIKLAKLVLKSLHGETPSYLANDCELIADSGRRRLRSANANALTVPRTYTRLGDVNFSVSGPKVWNSLPATLGKPNIEFVQFKRLLKTFLFGETAAH